jgi:hypothetical protein
MKISISKIKLELLSLTIGSYFLIDKLIQIFTYQYKVGKPFNSVDLLTSDLILGAHGGESIAGYPMKYLMVGAWWWFLFIMAIIFEFIISSKIMKSIIISLSLIYGFYTLLTLIYILTEVSGTDYSREYFQILFFSRLFLLVIFTIISWGWLRKRQKQMGN